MSVKKHIIRFDNVSKTFERRRREVPVLHEVDLHIYPQEFTVVYGPSGSGKSTLLNIMIGLESPSRGSVFVEGRDIFRLNEDGRAKFRSRHFGVVYQQSYWVKSLNVLENVALPLVLRGNEWGHAQARAEHSLSEVGMVEFANKHPSQLSGGEQQRVSLARALSVDPLVIVADEPTGNLDTKSGNQVIELLLNFIERFGRAVVMVTHELRFLEFADRAVSIKDGRIEGSFNKEETKDIIKKLETAGIK